jgi:hypothetical protein
MATERNAIRLQFAVGLAFFLFMFASTAFAYSEKPAEQEYEVMAAYLFNFARLTEWPVDAFSLTENHFSICVLGEDHFEGSLDLLRGRVIDGHNVLIRQIDRVQKSAGCNLLFVSSSETDNLSKIISYVMYDPVLTVSDIKGFDDAGGIISLFLKNNRLKFRINLEAAGKAKLKISSYLL